MTHTAESSLPTRRIAWLIERKFPADYLQPPEIRWYAENNLGFHWWTPTAHMAKQFASKADAEAFQAYLLIESDPSISITEHVFIAKEPCGECHLHPGETCDICGAFKSEAERLSGLLLENERLYDADAPMADGEIRMTAAEEVLAWLLIEKIGTPDDRSYTPNEAQSILEAYILKAQAGAKP